MVGWFRRFRPSPPSAGLVPCPSASAFLFPCPFRVCPLRARCVGVGACSLLFFCVPLLVSRLSNLSCHFHFQLIFIPPFILTSTSLHTNNSALGRVCVCVKRLNRRKTSRPAHLYIILVYVSLQQGITGVPGVSVINEDTSPGPV